MYKIPFLKSLKLGVIACFLLFLSSSPLFPQSISSGEKIVILILPTADYCFQTKDYKNAVYFYQKIVEYGDDSIDKALYTYLISYSFYMQRNYQKAIDQADRVIANYKTYLDYAYYIKGCCYQNLGQYEKASQSFNQLLKEQPASEFVNLTKFQLARTLYFQGKHQEALLAFKKLSKEPMDKELAKEVEENITFINQLLKKKR